MISSAVSFHLVLAITKWNAEGLYLFQGHLVPQCLQGYTYLMTHGFQREHHTVEQGICNLKLIIFNKKVFNGHKILTADIS